MSRRQDGKPAAQEDPEILSNMRLMMIMGGMLGFGTAVALGVARENSWPSILWRAAVAAYLGGILLRWWGAVWLRSLQEVHYQQRLALARAKAEAAKAKK